MPRSSLPRPRRAALTLLAIRRRAGFVAFGSVFFAVGLIFAVAPWGMLERDLRIERTGTRTTAVVSDLRITEDSEGGDDYEVHYAFLLPGGERVEDRATVSRRAFETVEVGDRLRVAYDPDRPRDGYPIGNGPDLDGGMRSPWAAAAFSAFGLVFATIGGLFLWGLLVRLPGMWVRLLREGTSVEGRVTRIEVGDDNASQARLHYAFEDRFGTRCEAETEWGPRRAVKAWAEGDRGLVQYDRRNAEQSVWLGHGDLTFYR